MRSLCAQLRSRKWRWPALVLVALLMAGWIGADSVAARQFGQSSQFPEQTPPPLGAPRDASDPDARQREEKLAKGRNADRQQRLVSDTDKLLALAKELKEEVDKSNKDTLSIEVVKKASEIEKLAKSVKERMRE